MTSHALWQLILLSLRGQNVLEWTTKQLWAFSKSVNIWHCWAIYKKHKDLRHPSLWRPTCLMKCELSGQLPGELECATMCVFLLDFWPGSAYGSSETPLRVWSVSVLPCCFDLLFVWTMWSDWRKFHCASSRHSHSHTIHTEPTYKLAETLALTQHSIIYQELQCRP